MILSILQRNADYPSIQTNGADKGFSGNLKEQGQPENQLNQQMRDNLRAFMDNQAKEILYGSRKIQDILDNQAKELDKQNSFKQVDLKEFSVSKVSYKEAFGVSGQGEEELRNKITHAIDSATDYATRGASAVGTVLIAVGDNISFGATKWIRNHTYDKEDKSVDYNATVYKVGDWGATGAQLITGVGAIKVGAGKLTAKSLEKAAREAEITERVVFLNSYKEADSLIAIKHGTKIDDAVIYSGKKSNLPKYQQDTFSGNSYLPYNQVYGNQVKLFREFGDEAKLQGGFSTTIPNATREELALLPEWNNSRRFLAEIEPPYTEILNIGKAKAQTSKTGVVYQGGGDQIVMDKNISLKYTKSIIDRQTGKVYTLEEFKKTFPHLIKK